MIRCVLFDRDGTLGALGDDRYPQSFVPFCDIKEVFTRIKSLGYFVGVITNQASIARGTGNEYDFGKEFSSYGCDVWKICPHDSSDDCDCRKPKSGLLIAAASELNLTPKECLVVGDRMGDVTCAVSVGAYAALTLTGKGEAERSAVANAYPNTPVLRRFDDVISLLNSYRTDG